MWDTKTNKPVLDTSEVVRLYKKLHTRARALGYRPQEAEELVQRAMLNYVKQNKTGQSTDQALVDSIRHTYGRGAATEKRKKEVLIDDASIIMQYAAKNAVMPSIVETVGKLEGKERAIIILYYKWGLDLKEIGEAFGFSESRAKQILKEAALKIRYHEKED